MNKFAIYIPFSLNDEIHLLNALNRLNSYNQNFEVHLVRTVPKKFGLGAHLTDILPTDFEEIENIYNYDNLKIKLYEYRYFCDSNIYDFTKNEFDFAKLKNIAFHIIQNDWILFLDSDELVSFDPDFFEWFLNENQNEEIGGFNFNVLSYIQENEGSQNIFNKQCRLVKNLVQFVFTNRIHEEIETSIKYNNYVIVDSPNYLIHRGYNNPEVVMPKSYRNIGLLAITLSKDITNKYLRNKLKDHIENFYMNLTGSEIQKLDYSFIKTTLSFLHKSNIEIQLELEKFLNDTKENLIQIATKQDNIEMLKELYNKLNIINQLGVL